MGTVYRKTTTRDLPAGAEIVTRQGQQFARWKDAKGKSRTAKVTTGRDGKPRIVTEATTVAVSPSTVKQNNPLTSAVNGLREVERKGVEPSTSALRTQAGVVPTDNGQALATTAAPVCTRICTGNGETVHGEPPDGVQGDRLATLAAELAKLSPADRERLVGLLASKDS